MRLCGNFFRAVPVFRVVEVVSGQPKKTCLLFFVFFLFNHNYVCAYKKTKDSDFVSDIENVIIE